MGEVYEALDRDRSDVIAIKTLARTDGDTFARFKREFRALQSTAHQNLVSIGELVCADGLWFFTMELVDGTHFLEYVRGDGNKLRLALRQLVVGLRALHEAGFVHRDVKPSNVMVTREGRVVILDFGLVTTLDPSRQSSVNGPIGTVEYMAPEQATGRQVGEAADWYSVGVMLYEALTGAMPHSGHALQILVAKQEVEPQAPETLAADAPHDLSKLCMDLLAIEPDKRPNGTAIARRLGLDPDLDRTHRTSTPTPSPAFVGRERECAELEASAVFVGKQPRIHLVIGESGIGKSELVARFARSFAARDPEVVLLSGRCYERESVPYKALDGVIDGLVQVLARMPVEEVRELLPARPALLMRLFPAFHRVAAIATAPLTEHEIGEPHELRRRMFIALRELLAEVARKRSVVITIDDLQWADADSFILMRELLRGVRAPHVLVLATVRGEDTALETALRDLPVERTRLGPLNDDECRALAESVVPGAAARFDLARVSREAGGHPMFLQEVLRHLALTGGGEAGATLDDALSARIALLRTEARMLLEIVCIAGAPLSYETAAEASRLDATTMARAAASLRVATLVRETQRGRRLALEPYHDRVRETVDRRIDAGTRRDLHARIAHALEVTHEPRDPQLLLRNFLLAEMPDRAVGYAEEAAQRSEDAHAFDQAAELWRTALETVPREPNDRRRVLLRLGQVLINAGRGAEAAQHYLDAAVGADRATRLECHRHAAEQLMISGHIKPGIAVLEELLAEIGVASPKTPRRTVLSLLWHRTQLRVRGLGFRERSRREITDARLLELEVLKIAGASLAVVDVIRGMEFQSRYLRMALRTGHLDHIVRALLIESPYLATASKPARAEQYIARAMEIGADPSDPYVKATIAGTRATGMYMRGDIVPAVPLFEECLTTIRLAPGNNWEGATARLLQLFSLRFIGDYNMLRAKYEEHLTDAAYRGDRYLESTMRRACVSMWLAEDNVDGAVRELETATWVPPEGRYHVQHFHELVAWAEIGLYCGSLDARARLAERFAGLHGSLLLRVESIRVQTAYLRGRLAIADYLPAAEAARAVRRLRRENNPLAAVWATLIQAGVAAGTDPARAEMLYERVVESAERAGMQSTAAVARARVATLRGDAAMGESARKQLLELGVHDPERTCELLAPMRRSTALVVSAARA
jgi:hypothetical protein